MQKSFNINTVFYVLLFWTAIITAQETGFKDVILDGKPAKLNVSTGEITLVSNKKNNKSINQTRANDSIKTNLLNEADFHIVRQGETLLNISEVYQVPINQLKQVNGLETTLVDVGEKIRVRNFESYKPEISKVTNKSVQNFNSDYHTIKEGETLYSIGIRYDIDLNLLKSENNISSNIIKVGQKLKIRNFDLDSDLNSISIWVVKKGDTLYSIAEKTGTSVEMLKNLNGLRTDVIKIGQKIVLR